MKKQKILFLVILVSLNTVFCFNLFSNNPNLVFSEGFEQVNESLNTTGQIGIWNYYHYCRGSISFTNSESYSDNQSLMFETDDNSNQNIANLESENLSSVFQVEPNTKYKISLWLKTRNVESESGGVIIKTHELTSDKSPTYKENIIVQTDGSSRWEVHEISFVTEPSSYYVDIIIQQYFMNGSFWIDDISIEKVSFPELNNEQVLIITGIIILLILSLIIIKLKSS